MAGWIDNNIDFYNFLIIWKLKMLLEKLLNQNNEDDYIQIYKTHNFPLSY